MSYDIKFRRQVLKIREKEGLSFSKVAELFGISKQTVYNWSKRIEEKKNRERTYKIDEEALAADVLSHPDSYLYERAERFKVSINYIWRALKRLGVTYKKNSQASQSGSRKEIYFLPNG